MKKENNFELIHKLYIEWLNEEDIFMKRKRKEDIKSKVSKYDMLMYSIKFAMPFQAFREIFPLADLLKTLEQMEERGEDITNITNQILLIQGIEDIQELNRFSQKRITTKVGDFRLRFQGNKLFEFGDVKSIGEKFPYACVNFIDIAEVEQMIKNEEYYKGVPIIITIDNMGELPLDKLSDIEKKFDVAGVRIIEKERTVKIEQNPRPISLTDYKQIQKVVDNEILSKLYVSENLNNKMIEDCQLATQIFCLITDKVKYDKEFKEKHKQMSLEEMTSYYSDVSNILGLITGKTICGGYAEILRNVLSCVDIKSKTIIGKTSDGGGHAWNQIKLGDKWFNTDLTIDMEEVGKGKTSGDLLMSDVDFYGNRRDIVFGKGQYRNGESIETIVTGGGHTGVLNSNTEKCEGSFPPDMVAILLRRAREYEEDYKEYGKSQNYKGAVPYVGSSIEKIRSGAKNVVTSIPSERVK